MMTTKTLGLTVCAALTMGWLAGDASARVLRPFPGLSGHDPVKVTKWYRQTRRAALGRPGVPRRPAAVTRTAKLDATVRAGSLYYQLRSGWRPETRAQYDRAARTIGATRQALGAATLGGLRQHKHLNWMLQKLKLYEPRFYR